MANQTGDRGFNTVRNSSVAKRERNRAMQKYTILGVIALATLAVAVLLVMAVGGIIANIREASGKAPSSEKVEWASFTVTATDALQGPLVLVNNTHVYTFPANEDHLSEIYAMYKSHTPRKYVQSGLSTYMETEALKALDTMLVDFYNLTGKDNVLRVWPPRPARSAPSAAPRCAEPSLSRTGSPWTAGAPGRSPGAGRRSP